MLETRYSGNSESQAKLPSANLGVSQMAVLQSYHSLFVRLVNKAPTGLEDFTET